MNSLAQRAKVALAWGLGAALVKLFLTIAVQAVLARLLGPQEFGLFAICMLAFGFAMYFADAGVATSLVHREALQDEDISTVWTICLLVALSVGTVFALAAPHTAALFSKPELTTPLMLMAPAFAMNAAASVSLSLLRRKLDYRSIQTAQLAGYTFGFGGVGICAALIDGSALAMVSAFVAQSAITLALLYRATRHPLRLHWRPSALLGSHSRFGVKILATNLVNWMLQSTDRLIVGRAFTAEIVGMYTVAYNLVSAPVNVVYPTLQSVFFSATARLQEDLAARQRVYLEAIRTVTVVSFPLFAAVAALSSSLVMTIYGKAFAQSAGVVTPFALMAPFLLIWGVSTPMLWNSGRTTTEFLSQLPFLLVCGVVIWFASHRAGIIGVAWCTAALFIIRTAVVVSLVAQALKLGITEVVKCFGNGLYIAALAAGSTLAVERLAQGRLEDGLTRLIIGLAAAATTTAALIGMRPTSLPASLRRPIGRWGNRVAPRASNLWRRFDSGDAP